MPTYHLPPSSAMYPDYSGGLGNCSEEVYPIAAGATGILLDSSASAAIAAADVVRLAYLPKGFQVTHVTANVSTAAGQALTANVGFAYVDGADDSTFPQNATAYFSALAFNSAARTQMTSAGEVKKLPKAAYLILTFAGATLASAMKAQFIVRGIQR